MVKRMSEDFNLNPAQGSGITVPSQGVQQDVVAAPAGPGHRAGQELCEQRQPEGQRRSPEELSGKIPHPPPPPPRAPTG